MNFQRLYIGQVPPCVHSPLRTISRHLFHRWRSREDPVAPSPSSRPQYTLVTSFLSPPSYGNKSLVSSALASLKVGRRKRQMCNERRSGTASITLVPLKREMGSDL